MATKSPINRGKIATEITGRIIQQCLGDADGVITTGRKPRITKDATDNKQYPVLRDGPLHF